MHAAGHYSVTVTLQVCTCVHLCVALHVCFPAQPSCSNYVYCCLYKIFKKISLKKYYIHHHIMLVNTRNL
jgi:hypothetical protein